MNQDMRAKFLSTYPAAHSRDYDAMVQVEADEQMAVAGDLRTPKNQKAAELVAQERIQKWADEAHEFAIGSLNFPLSGFVAGEVTNPNNFMAITSAEGERKFRFGLRLTF